LAVLTRPGDLPPAAGLPRTTTLPPTAASHCQLHCLSRPHPLAEKRAGVTELTDQIQAFVKGK
jgi:hypothetical protein